MKSIFNESMKSRSSTKKVLIEQYVRGWKERNMQSILDTLSNDCIVIESHGPVYKGKSAVEQWVKQWSYNESRVTKWDITSFYPIGNTVVFEWDFSCVVRGKTHDLLGISIVKIKQGKISFLHEYRMTQKPFV